jgi:hypothetical protein
MTMRRMHMLEIAKYYQRLKNREAEKKQEEKPKGLFRRLLKK